MTQEPAGAGGAPTLKGGGGSREYMSEFARGRVDLDCESCGFNMRRNSDFGTEADGAYTERYCAICYANGAFRHPASTVDEFLALSIEEFAVARKSGSGKLRLTMKKELPRLARWKKK